MLPSVVNRIAILFFYIAACLLSVSSFAYELDAVNSLLASSCLECHSGDQPSGDFLIPARIDDLAAQIETMPWERIVRKLRAGQMPPPDAEQPPAELLAKARASLESWLDEADARWPVVGKIDSIKRMTRAEYQNAIRDLLHLEVDAKDWLPKDESSHGFDNITVGELTPILVQRALSAAQAISRLAVGVQSLGPEGATIRIPPDRTQELHVDGLPLGTRGGTVFPYNFTRDGRYEIQLRLTRDRDEKVEGLTRPHSLDILIDRKLEHRFAIEPPADRQDYTLADAHLKTSIYASAGQHDVGVTFPQTGESLLEIKRQPFDAAFNRHRHPRVNPALFEVSIVGPLGESKPNRTASRIRIFEEPFEDARIDPQASLEDRDKAECIVRFLCRLAYRREVTNEDVEIPLKFFDQAWMGSDSPKGSQSESTTKIVGDNQTRFENAIESAITAILVNPNFLLRVEGLVSRAAETRKNFMPISNTELATRLSFFLWSSIPDRKLLDVANMPDGAASLTNREVLSQQIDRMLDDRRSKSLVKNFATQWLYLTNLESTTPDLRMFPDFDDNLRQAFRQETERFVEDIFENNRSLLELLRSKKTFVNERLAKHYGIPGIVGSHFRTLENADAYDRGGLLRHGSILTVTSYANRTSPTNRGNWILKNLVGTPPPPPPPNVPALGEKKTSMEALSVRERLAIHRSNPACASCHNLMDPVGFSLEHFDALGRLRTLEDGLPINASGIMPDGSEVANLRDLEENLLMRPEVFVGTIVEKLMVFALGRGLLPTDGPEIRRIVKHAAEHDYQFRSIVHGIASSRQFTMRDPQ
jgi:Protein of unknown function (DUF1592)/Protein of unknown function (DUF1588)/Protein of unknown function (DUF1585)/Protein of unknown function (DUF1587)/Protein of unknown function (DUF1595)